MVRIDRKRPWAPSIVFLVVIASSLVSGRSGFFNDPGTFWHLRLGREILRTGRVPQSDFLTSTRWGTPWIDQSWLFDAALAWVHERGGWSLVAGLTALLLGAIYAALAWWLEARGNSCLVATAISLVAASIGSVHFLARPHLFTLAGVLWFLNACWAYRARGSGWIWSLPAVSAVWANLHGGFVAGPLIALTAALGTVVSGPRDRQSWRRGMTFCLVAALSAASALLNPYGVQLYLHVSHLLFASRVTDLIQEYQPARLGRIDLVTLELSFVTLVALPAWSRKRPSVYDLAHAVLWLHLGVSSIRNVPLFALAAAPILADLITGVLPSTRALESRPTVDCASKGYPACAWRFLAIALATGAVVLLACTTKLGGPDPRRWPMAALRVLDRQPTSARLFHDQDWGGLIECESRPPRLAAMDDRFELWGRAALLGYVEAMKGGPGWDDLNTREEFELVWVRPTRGLAKRLERDPHWRILYRDRISILFSRAPSADNSLAHDTSSGQRADQ